MFEVLEMIDKWWSVFDYRLLFTPFGTINRKVLFNDGRTYMAFTDYFIFGFRVARIQRSEPWSE